MNLKNIIAQFQSYLNEEIDTRRQRLPYACCLSTIGLDGFPNARFVSLKEIRNDQFVISGTLSSRKGEELKHNNKVALTFWWPETQRQVRIQGIAQNIEGGLVDTYFHQRNLESQIVSIVSNQGEYVTNLQELVEKYDQYAWDLGTAKNAPRPHNWGAIEIDPIRIEFLTFSETRFHDRILFQKEPGTWRESRLQP